jgi:fructoselysine-6-P-deglycase FrlB-like protein
MTTTAREIESQPRTWQRALSDATIRAEASAVLAARGERVLAIGCGTSWFVAQSYAAIREAAGLGETDAACASEATGLRAYDRVVVFSRSGTTTELLDAVARLPAGIKAVAVVGVGNTPLVDRCDRALVLPFADEQSVVQTRFPTTVLALARQACGQRVDQLVADCQAALAAPLPEPVSHVVFLGRGWTVGLANEAALKVREAAQAWSESYPAMDFRHGPIAVVGPGSLVWGFGPMPDGLADAVVRTGASLHTDTLDPLAGLVMAQRFAVAMAATRGLDPDRPRHLTRSVILPRG